MKVTSLTLLALTVTATLSLGQSAPAESASKTTTAQTSGLTKEERERAINYLNETQKDFLAAIDGLSEAQWKFKAAPEKWSIAETAEHITLTEGLVWNRVTDTIMKSPAAPERRAEVQGKEEMILKVIPDRSRKANAPEQLHPTGKWPTRAELVKEFERLRGAEIAFIGNTTEDLRSHFGDHPFLKTMDAWQWLIFNGAHCKRHTAQIEEVKADPNYPRS